MGETSQTCNWHWAKSVLSQVPEINIERNWERNRREWVSDQSKPVLFLFQISPRVILSNKKALSFRYFKLFRQGSLSDSLQITLPVRCSGSACLARHTSTSLHTMKQFILAWPKMSLLATQRGFANNKCISVFSVHSAKDNWFSVTHTVKYGVFV